MKQKKVLCCQVDIPEEYDFLDMLGIKQSFCRKTVPYNDKKIELSHLSVYGDFVTGMFVTTQVRNIPPVHEPGNEADYSAIEIEDGKGLAYPNVFLYHHEKRILLWEINRFGVTESAISYFFNDILLNENLSGCRINLYPMMSMDAYSKIIRMTRIDEIEFQIVHPLGYLREESKNDTLANVARLASDFSATKSIKITIRAEDTDSVKKSPVLRIADFFRQMTLTPNSRMKNKFVIKGPLEEDGVCVEETINYMSDRMTGFFDIEEPRIASHLQVNERKDGIKNAYKTLKKELDVLLA